MPPYTPVVSKAQSRALFAKAGRGEISMADAKGKTRAATWSKLPQRVATSRPTGRKRGVQVKRTPSIRRGAGRAR